MSCKKVLGCPVWFLLLLLVLLYCGVRWMAIASDDIPPKLRLERLHQKRKFSTVLSYGVTADVPPDVPPVIN